MMKLSDVFCLLSQAWDTKKVYRDKADWWVGVYFGPNHVYVCPLPTLVLRFDNQA